MVSQKTSNLILIFMMYIYNECECALVRMCSRLPGGSRGYILVTQVRVVPSRWERMHAGCARVHAGASGITRQQRCTLERTGVRESTGMRAIPRRCVAPTVPRISLVFHL